MLKKPLFVLICDIVILNITILAMFSIRFLGNVPRENMIAFANNYLLITGVYIVLLYMQGMYDFEETDDSLSVFFKIFTVIALGTVSMMALTFLNRQFAFPRTVIALSFVVLLIIFSMWRITAHEFFLRSLPKRRIILYGDHDRIVHLERIIERGSSRYRHAGSFEIGMESELRDALSAGSADWLIITDSVPGIQEIAFDLFLSYKKLVVLTVPKISTIISGARHSFVLGDVPLIALSRKTPGTRLFLLKRITDVTLALVSLVFLLPFFAIMSLLIKILMPGPVFYTQDRVGRNGREFRIIKFRTMVVNAEELTGPVLSSGDKDPRVTPLGRLMRKFKIDEMPQVFNIIRGEMSFVGPRPERRVFVEQFEKLYPGYSERTTVLPGLTGLAQVNGWYESDPTIKLKYDLLYVYNYNPLLDLVIAYNTIQFVLRDNMKHK